MLTELDWPCVGGSFLQICRGVAFGALKMAFRYDEIGQRLKAYRMGSGRSADEIAKNIGISRTALYRFERGELAKIETLERLAELLGVSIPTLLGVGIEYIPSAVSYFERMRQIEETAEHIVILSGPISFLLASDDFQAALEDVLSENITNVVANAARAKSDIPKIIEILRERKELYRKRRPTIVNLMSAFEVERFLDHGFVGRKGLPEAVLAKRKLLACAEIKHFANLIEQQPIGVQIGIVPDTLPHAGFQLFRQPERKLLVMSPFRLGGEPNVRVGVAMITSAPDGIALHENAINEMWSRALKGQVAAECLRDLLATAEKSRHGSRADKSSASPKRKPRQ
jgi:transcriptional regulator with XRE-family HTH domain